MLLQYFIHHFTAAASERCRRFPLLWRIYCMYVSFVETARKWLAPFNQVNTCCSAVDVPTCTAMVKL